MFLVIQLWALVMWGAVGWMIAHELEGPWYQKVAAIFVWPFIVGAAVAYWIYGAWSRRFY